MKRYSSIVVAVILFSIAGCNENPFAGDSETLTSEEYQIFNDILPQPDTAMTLDAFTATDEFFDSSHSYETMSRYYRQRANIILDSEMVVDFFNKIRLSVKIEKRRLINPGILLTDNKTAPGTTTFSRVGLNAGRNKALIYISHFAGPLAGYGETCYLEKKVSRWIIVARLMEWIS